MSLWEKYPEHTTTMLEKLNATFLLSDGSDLDDLSRWGEYILKNMIYGVDLDIRAVYISSQVLTLSSLQMIRNCQHFPTFVNLNLKQGNSLISPVRLNAEDTTMLSKEIQKYYSGSN